MGIKETALAATLLLPGCADLPLGTDALTEEESEAISDRIEEDRKAIQFATELFPYMPPLWGLDGKPVSDNQELALAYNGIFADLKRRHEEGRVVVGFEEFLNVNFIEPGARGMAYGALTPELEDNYIIIPYSPELESESVRFDTPPIGIMFHEQIHYNYGGHKAEVPTDSDGEVGGSEFASFVRQHRDAPYLATTLASNGFNLDFKLNTDLTTEYDYDQIVEDIEAGETTPVDKYKHYESKLENLSIEGLSNNAWSAYGDRGTMNELQALGLTKEGFEAYIEDHVEEWLETRQDKCKEIMDNLLRDYPEAFDEE